MRIVSLCPSNTEILFALEAGGDVVAVDQWSDYPPEARSLPKVGPELDADINCVASHKPDLVLASLTVPGMERNVEALQREGIPHLVLNPKSLEDIFLDIESVGKAIGRSGEADGLVRDMRAEIEALRSEGRLRRRRAGVYIEWWPKPVLTPGARCWTRGMIEAAGGRNIFDDLEARSGTVSLDEVAQRNPDLILLCWCGIRKEKILPRLATRRAGWDKINAVKRGAVHAVEEGWYGRPGPRVTSGIRQMREWIKDIP